MFSFIQITKISPINQIACHFVKPQLTFQFWPIMETLGSAQAVLWFLSSCLSCPHHSTTHYYSLPISFHFECLASLSFLCKSWYIYTKIVQILPYGITVSECTVPLVEAWPVKKITVSFGLLSLCPSLFSINFFLVAFHFHLNLKYQHLGWDAGREGKSAVMRQVPLPWPTDSHSWSAFSLWFQTM